MYIRCSVESLEPPASLLAGPAQLELVDMIIRPCTNADSALTIMYVLLVLLALIIIRGWRHKTLLRVRVAASCDDTFFTARPKQN
jgi:hypothetical protein